ncbi:MAG TPA: hypothetical protein VFN57_19525 [Thermomicrobiaceae bacterium]|nr:hypothetical protein [Thermomicrobiaceae bacterium]
MDEERRNEEQRRRPGGERPGGYESSRAHDRGDAEAGGPVAGEQHVHDSGVTAEMRGKHPLQPAEGPRKADYDEPDGESGRSNG